MPEAIIELKSLVKTYDTGEVQVQALRGVDLAVERGEMVAIMGPSGCGKTTLLNTASGLDDPTEGSITIEGTDLGSLDDNTKTSYRARRMGFIFQFYNLLPVLSAVENVVLPLLVSGTPPAEVSSPDPPDPERESSPRVAQPPRESRAPAATPVLTKVRRSISVMVRPRTLGSPWRNPDCIRAAIHLA